MINQRHIAYLKTVIDDFVVQQAAEDNASFTGEELVAALRVLADEYENVGIKSVRKWRND